MRRRPVLAAATVVVLAAVASVLWAVTRDREESTAAPATGLAGLVPAPARVVAADDVSFTIPAGVPVVAAAGSTDVVRVGGYLAQLLGGVVRSGDGPVSGGIALLIDESQAAQAYELDVDAAGITIRAAAADGLFWGVQTLRQLLPTDPGAALVVPGGRIIDRPRFAYRGVMLDVARHFFHVSDVERLIDLAALYKVNYLHLHLSDDQGWRIAIPQWPRLTSYGAGTEVGGGPGGYYTADDYAEIVAYAAGRFMTVVPEIDLPGHTNAALASYPELTCDGVAPPRYTGIEVGFSALCPSEATYAFLEDVIGDLAALTPGPYLHIGGDEARTLDDDGYAAIVTRALAIVAAHEKTPIGWHDVAAVAPPSTVLQFWGTSPFADGVAAAAEAGNRFIMSPADRAYLDQKYRASDRIGLTWAGPTSVERSYGWDPASLLAGVDEPAVLGVEAPLWTETVTSMGDVEYLLLPRLASIAEIGWSPSSTHDWSAFRRRLAAQAPLWTSLGVNFARADGIAWPGR